MKLEDLKQQIPYKWRVQSANEYGANCVAYIDSRDVQDLFDKVCGAQNWSNKFEEHKGNLFCSIGIDLDGHWVWKSDCGTESQVEKQKGESSDAFKRAAVMWGVGRFLYNLDIIKIKEVAKDSKGKYYPTHNGSRVWDITDHCNKLINKKIVENKPTKPKLNPNTAEYRKVFDALRNGYTISQVKEKYTVSKEVESQLEKELGNTKA